MRSARYERMTKILADPDVMLRVAERIGRFELGTRDTRPGDASESFAPRQRAALQAHASYFRERYFESGSSVAGIEPLFGYDGSGPGLGSVSVSGSVSGSGAAPESDPRALQPAASRPIPNKSR